nr:citrate synthase [uncultured Pseudodesulfovibrio sp.]
MGKENTTTSDQKAKLTIGDATYELPIIVGTENEHAIDITNLRSETGFISYDPGYANTGSCSSNITFVDGEKGILRYRGYPIEELAAQGTFIETAYLLIFGELPTRAQRQEFRQLLDEQELLHEDLRHHFEGFPSNGHPMAILSAVINALGCYHPDLLQINTEEEFLRAAAKIISKVRTIAAWSYRKAHGLPFMYPDPKLTYCRNFLHMMHSLPHRPFEPTDAQVRALSLFFLLHADHEQNCSCSTVRMVQSTEANMFASVSAGICALWGRLHGGANAGVIAMLEQINEGDLSVKQCIERVKQKEFRLMGFGHRIYKSFDPRAKILREAAHNMLESTGYSDPLLDIALKLADTALNDEYFTERKLYPNVDFYSGIILRALGIPVNMFPVMFAIGRMPGWIAHWNEANTDGVTKIHRPRQIYTGLAPRKYVPLDSRL